ncbi:MAG: flagellar hook-length control protein FliK [Alphaproteobacteria bacterium]|nr:flagellar hook-length control protein FliK [Alphaproteobacteria bacterium]MCL2505513.1 flagellar hook-length control protein FliK [Alphaproteobacteria bacterium]
MIQQIADKIFPSQNSQSSASKKGADSGFSALMEAVVRNAETTGNTENNAETKVNIFSERDNFVKEKESQSIQKETSNDVDMNIEAPGLHECIQNLPQRLEVIKEKTKELQKLVSENEELSVQLSELLTLFQAIEPKIEEVALEELPDLDMQIVKDFLEFVEGIYEGIEIAPDLPEEESVDVYQLVAQFIAEVQKLMPEELEVISRPVAEVQERMPEEPEVIAQPVAEPQELMPEAAAEELLSEPAVEEPLPEVIAKEPELPIQEKPLDKFQNAVADKNQTKTPNEKLTKESVLENDSPDAEEIEQKILPLQKDVSTKPQSPVMDRVVNNKTFEFAKSESFLTPNTIQSENHAQNTGNNVVSFNSIGQGISFAKGEAAQHTQHSQPVTDQIMLLIQRSVKSGVTKMSLQLNPAELGKVTVNLNFAKSGGVTGIIHSDNPQTLVLLQRDIRMLEQSLQNAGIQIKDGDLSLGFDNNNKSNNAQGFFQDNKSKQSSSEEEQVIEYSNAYIVTPERVNIRV